MGKRQQEWREVCFDSCIVPLDFELSEVEGSRTAVDFAKTMQSVGGDLGHWSEQLLRDVGLSRGDARAMSS